MEKIFCRTCGFTDKYSTEMKGTQKVATCNMCGNFIKNIAYQPAKFYFGKYKGKEISECMDLEYLKWFVENTNPKANIKYACYLQISKINSIEKL
jgi:uncharacterized protein (DUF3820 family)